MQPHTSSDLVLAESSADFSRCRRYRYALRRTFGAAGTVMFVGLNPSTADETQDDPTIRRCIGFAKRWGYGRLIVANLYAWRATDPRELRAARRPVGEVRPDGLNLNDWWLSTLASEADYVVAAWGASPGPVRGRPERVVDLLSNCGSLYALELTKHRCPKHPLYTKATAEPVPYLRARAYGQIARAAA